MVTNSLQLVKQLALEGEYLAFTSELDTAPELMNGSLVFLPIRDTAVEAQSVSVAIDSRRPLSRVSRIVSERLVEEIANCLAAVRVKSRPLAATGQDRLLSERAPSGTSDTMRSDAGKTGSADPSAYPGRPL